MRTRDHLGRTTAAGFVCFALRAAKQFVEAEDTKAQPEKVLMYSRRVEDYMSLAADWLERLGGLALGWLSSRSPCQGTSDLTGYAITSGRRTPWAERVSASGCIERGKGCASMRRFSTR